MNMVRFFSVVFSVLCSLGGSGMSCLIVLRLVNITPICTFCCASYLSKVLTRSNQSIHVHFKQSFLEHSEERSPIHINKMISFRDTSI